MSNKQNHIINAVVIILFVSLMGFAQGSQRTKTITVKRNSFAPELYSEKLNLRVSLVNLPGAKTTGSNWETSYQVYFVPESDFDKSISTIRSREPVPQDFSEKILLAKGSFKKNPIKEISQRIVEKDGILFKSKIPNSSMTAFAKIIVFYTSKIYDAKLKQSVYSSSLFITPPFATNNSNKQPLRDLYLNFFVNENGKVYTSNQERDKQSISW